MAVMVSRGQRHVEERALLLRHVRDDWRQLRQAVNAKRPQAVMWRLHRVQQTKGMHRLSLAEMLVASGCVR
ncbi:MAG: hypothetical protein M3Q29_22250 [Chloroflexota bacterium]|nr:hypothetical protein [Chloroflexota bacterium]